MRTTVGNMESGRVDHRAAVPDEREIISGGDHGATIKVSTGGSKPGCTLLGWRGGIGVRGGSHVNSANNGVRRAARGKSVTKGRGDPGRGRDFVEERAVTEKMILITKETASRKMRKTSTRGG